jgi:FkbM family methyltransferase
MSAVRTALERLSRNRVVRRRLPADLGGGKLLVSPDASMRLWRRSLERTDPLLFGLARELVRPGMVVWDIGANVGLFAAAASFLAGPAGRVLAVEADGWLANLLRESFRGLPGGRAPITVLSAAAASANGVADLNVAQRGRAANHMASVAGSSQAGGVRAVETVMTVTLDWLLDRFPAPDLVKIDVEASEVECLRGAARLLRQQRPVVVCEVSAENATAAGRLLLDAGYLLYDATAPRQARRPLAAPAWNTLALPEPLQAPGGVPANRVAGGR